MKNCSHRQSSRLERMNICILLPVYKFTKVSLHTGPFVGNFCQQTSLKSVNLSVCQFRILAIFIILSLRLFQMFYTPNSLHHKLPNKPMRPSCLQRCTSLTTNESREKHYNKSSVYKSLFKVSDEKE